MLLKLMLRNLFTSAGLVGVFLAIALVVSAIVAVIAGAATLVPGRDAGTLDAELAGRHVGLAAYITVVVVTGVSFATLFSTPLIREREEGNLESLLATPLTIGHLWFAKSVALVVAGTGVAFACALGVAVVLWRVVGPDVPLELSQVLTVSTVVMVPLVYTALALLIYRIGLPGRAVDAAILVSVFLAGFTATMLNLAARDVVDPTSRGFLAVHVAWIVVLLVPSLVTRASLTKEKVVT